MNGVIDEGTFCEALHHITASLSLQKSVPAGGDTGSENAELPKQVSVGLTKHKQKAQSNQYTLLQVFQLAQCIESGVFEALERRYLRAVVLAFQDGEKPTAPLLEAYTLKVTYSASGEPELVLNDYHYGESKVSEKAASVVRCCEFEIVARTHSDLLHRPRRRAFAIRRHSFFET